MHLERDSTFVEITFFRPKNQVKTKKKRFSPKIAEFLLAKSSEDQKKRSSPQFGTKFGQNLWDLFVQPGTFSTVQPALKPRWGDAKS